MTLPAVRDYMVKYGMLPHEGAILACVSGGADSMMLLDILTELAPQHGFTVEVAHFDHRLRGAESDRDREFVAELCEKRGIRCHIGYGDTSEYAAEHKLGIEEAARELRYDFFRKTAKTLSNALIATAHNSDDNAETVLLNLARGSGTRGLAGIAPVRGAIIRPMLCITRAEIEKYLNERGISYINDSTNSSDEYTRNRLRHSVMPVMREANAAFSRHVLEAGERLRADDDYLFSLAERFLVEHGANGNISAKALSALPSPVAARVVTRLAGGSLSAVHISAVLALCGATDGTKSVNTPRGMFIRRYDALYFEADAVQTSFASAELFPGQSFELAGFRIACTEELFDSETAPCDNDQAESGIINNNFNLLLFKKAAICGRIIVRPRVSDDFIKISGRGVTKSLKKLFIEERIPKDRRGLIPVFADDNGPLAVAGVCVDARTVPQAGDEIYRISLERTENA